ncbi:MAG: MraY family glycosyltransferase [Nitrospiraceae bacterium]|nr:MraY family glycosyltransferase [Nitrospiraceae bacterium]
MTVGLIYYFISYFTAAFILALCLTPLLRPFAFAAGAVDTGTGRRAHAGIIPRLGGIGIFLAFVIPMGFSLTRGAWGDLYGKMVGVLAASAVVLVIGICDDLKGATVRNKLIAEVLAAVIIYAWGIRITDVSNPFGGHIALGLFSLPVTVLWIIVITNAVNLIDGLDGLAAGTGILVAATFTLLPGTDFHLQLAYIILAGSLAGFLIYNFPPASIFMGDAGSLFLGFFLASTSILSARKATALATLMIPIVAFMFPLMDMFYAVIRRYYRGVPLGEADREHIHHKLLAMGLSKKKVLLVISLVNVVVMVMVLLLVRQQLNVEFIGLILVVLAAVGGLRLFGYVEFVPFVRELQRNFEISRRSRYFNYIIKRFRRDAGSARTVEELKQRLDELMREYKFTRVRIFLHSYSEKEPFYAYAPEGLPASGKPLMLTFAVVSAEEHVGLVHLTREMDDDYLLCAAEMARAISEEVARFARLHQPVMSALSGRQKR